MKYGTELKTDRLVIRSWNLSEDDRQVFHELNSDKQIMHYFPFCRSREVADKVLAGAPIAVRYAKEAVQKGMDLSLDQGLRLEADLNILLHSTSDRAEGLQSFLERRDPRFTGQ